MLRDRSTYIFSPLVSGRTDIKPPLACDIILAECTFHLVTVGYLALGDLVSLFAEKLVGNGSFAFLVQHSKANLPL